VHRAPEPGPVRGDRVGLYDLFLTRPRRPSAGRRVRFPQPPSVGSLLTVKIRQPSHEFTFGVGMTFVSYSLVLTPVV
jgi:hypothetical protein